MDAVRAWRLRRRLFIANPTFPATFLFKYTITEQYLIRKYHRLVCAATWTSASAHSCG
jgi:hypothetical protein